MKGRIEGKLKKGRRDWKSKSTVWVGQNEDPGSRQRRRRTTKRRAKLKHQMAGQSQPRMDVHLAQVRFTWIQGRQTEYDKWLFWLRPSSKIRPNASVCLPGKGQAASSAKAKHQPSSSSSQLQMCCNVQRDDHNNLKTKWWKTHQRHRQNTENRT